MSFVVYNGQKIEYTLKRKNVKNINLRVCSDGSVRVSANSCVPESEIERFVRSNADRILRVKEHLSVSCSALCELNDGDRIHLLGNEYELEILKSSKAGFEISDSTVILFVKNPFEYKNRKSAFDLLRRDLAEKIFTEIINDCYNTFSSVCMDVPQLKIRDMKTQWGNCRSSKNIITLNLKLVSYSKNVIRFVVMHEYCHFVHPNHSKDFYALLSKVMPDWKIYDDVLKNKSNNC